MVASSDSPLDAEDRAMSRLITSAERRVAAISNVVRVRVDEGHRARTTVNPMKPQSASSLVVSGVNR